MSYLVEDINSQKVELMNRLRVKAGSGIAGACSTLATSAPQPLGCVG